MKLTVFSLKGIEFSGEVTGFNVKTTSGEITVLDHHRPLMTILSKGTAAILLPGETRKEIPVHGGFLEMSPSNELSVLLH